MRYFGSRASLPARDLVFESVFDVLAPQTCKGFVGVAESTSGFYGRDAGGTAAIRKGR